MSGLTSKKLTRRLMTTQTRIPPPPRRFQEPQMLGKQTFFKLKFNLIHGSNFCPLLISISVLFMSDNLFLGGQQEDFQNLKILFSSPKNKLSVLNKIYMYIGRNW